MNSAKSDTTVWTASYQQFGREIRTINVVVNNFQAFAENDSSVVKITLYLKSLANASKSEKKRVETKRD